MEKSKKATTVCRRKFSDLATIEASQDSRITITNRKWHIVVDQYMGYKESKFYCMKPPCKKFSK